MKCPLKVVFLDIDGPMIPARARFLPGNGFNRWGWTFDPAAVMKLNFLGWAIPELRLVISSHRWGDNIANLSHRVTSPYPDMPCFQDKEFWERVLKDQGLNVLLHEDWKTVRKFHAHLYMKRAKCFEIQDWLRQHPEVTNFVVLDDDLNGGDKISPQMRKLFRLVAESYDDGITWADFLKMCRYLGLKDHSDKYAEYNKLLAI